MADKAAEGEYSRAEFFGLTVKKGAQYGKHLAYGILSPLAAILDDSDHWEEITEAANLGAEPRFIYRKGQPFILLLEEGKIRAYQGGCPSDQFFLQYLSAQGQFYCAKCQKAYPANVLKPAAVKSEQGKYYLRA